MAFTIDLGGQVALVTGGIQGIGLAIGKTLAQAGARVVVCDIFEADSDKVHIGMGALRDAGDQEPAYLRHDLSIQENCYAMVDDIEAAFRRLDILVLNAAIVGKNGNWEAAFNVNVKGLWFTCDHARDLLAKTGGRVVILTSASVITGGTGIPEYIATKGGASAMIRYIAREFAPLGVRVNGVAPAVIMTDMTLTRFGSAEAMLEHYKGRLPLNRIGTVEDVANGVLYLASDMSSWTCGETLLLDGGRLYLQ